MRDYTLSNKKIAELEMLHRSLRDKRWADRVKAVLALSEGGSPAQGSPNLNLIERDWKFFKKKVLNNCDYETFETFKFNLRPDWQLCRRDRFPDKCH